jgi:ornithine carbamoyltransferase
MKKGFTLIEMLIVIAVISILIGIALPRFKGMQDEGNIAKAKGELRTLQTAVESYRIHNTAYPATYPGDIEGATVAWIGDGNNMCHSYINAAIRFNFHLHIACPPNHAPDSNLVDSAGDRVKIFDSASQAARNTDLVVTDAWASMGQEQEREERLRSFSQFQVSDEIMAMADKDALFMHCLPVYRGEEVSLSVFEGEQSVVWQEAENRLHAQKALLEILLKQP